MIKDIKYNGYTEVPDDYECPDGDLAGVVDLVPEDGALKPVLPPSGKFVLPDGWSLPFIHDTPDYTHYILEDDAGNVLRWLDGDAVEGYPDKPVPADVVEDMAGGGGSPVSGGLVHDFDAPVDCVQAVGNMLCVSSGGTTHYVLWKPSAGGYVYLGDVIPHPSIQFRLKLRYVQDFKDFKETGIKIVKVSESSDAKTYSQVVSPTPVTTGDFSEEMLMTITPDSALKKDTSYKLVVSRRLKGKQATPFSVYLVYDDNGTELRQYAAFSTAGMELFPYAVFVTDSSKTVKRIELVLWANGKQTKNIELTLLEGTDYTGGYILKDTEEMFTAVMARANEFISRYSTEKNMFMCPFFVRYALRLYDGSYVSCGAPCLMVPNRGTVPRLWFMRASGDEYSVNTFASASFGQLLYRIVDSPDMEDWQDIITGVAFAVSDPIWNYNQGKEWKGGEHAIGVRLMDWNDLTRGDDVWSYGSYDNGDGVCSLTYLIYNSTMEHPEAREFVLPHFEEKAIDEQVKGVSVFHIVSDVDMKDLPTDGSWDYVDMKEGTLATLAARRVLEDNTLSLSARSGGAMSVYNSRLVLADVTERRFNGHRLQTMQGYCSWGLNGGRGSGRTTLLGSKVIIEYSDGTETHTLCSSDVARKSNEGAVFWVYYPGTGAKSAVIAQQDLTNRWRFAEVSLRPHDTLDGSYWFDGFGEPDWGDWTAYNSLDADHKAWADMGDRYALVRNASKVQQSEVNNPLVFTNLRTNLVGTGRVMAVCAAVKALSQGQFGHFPLYAFMTEGVWSMSVGDNGAFSAIQPVTRDVCTNVGSITQLDDSVLFATDRGIMQLSGSKVTCISDKLKGTEPFDVSTLPGASALLEASECEGGETAYEPLLDYIKDAKMLYDYVHQRVVVYNPDKSYAYVYSLDGGGWGMMRSDLEDGVNSWPEAFGVESDGTVVDFSETDPTEGVKGMLVTRPFKLEPHDALKTINTIIQRGMFDFHNSGGVKKVQQILYGSRDLYNWHLVWSSQDQYLRGFRGTPYKYFRLALICNLDEGERLYGFTVQYEPRYLNQPR